MAPQPLNTLEGLLKDALAETPPGRSIWVALSGGLDSCLMLALAAVVCERADRPLRAIHINHGLQAAASRFEAHCRTLCEHINVPLSVVKVAVDTHGEGIEGAARNARYEAFLPRCPQGMRFGSPSTRTIKPKPFCWRRCAAAVCVVWRVCLIDVMPRASRCCGRG